MILRLVLGTFIFGLPIYGLWWLHNDHPFYAALCAGFLVASWVQLYTYRMGKYVVAVVRMNETRITK